MWICTGGKIVGYDYKYVDMFPNDFDKLMCTSFRDILQKRDKYVSRAPLTRGFEIGPGWYPCLYSLCAQLDLIYRVTGLLVIVDQIKTKLGGLRIYYTIHDINSDEAIRTSKPDKEIWKSVLNQLCDDAQQDSYKICSKCGLALRHRQIHIDGWIYDMCSKCIIEEKPSLAKKITKWLRDNEDRRL